MAARCPCPRAAWARSWPHSPAPRTAAGAEIRTGAPVQRILVEKDAAAGVALASGETLRAPLVLCSADAGTLLRLTGPEHFDAEMVRRIRHVRAKGVTAKLNFALSGPPRFAGLDEAAHRGRILLGPLAALRRGRLQSGQVRRDVARSRCSTSPSRRWPTRRSPTRAAMCSRW